MAKGDVVNDVFTLTSGANSDFQPSAGVEVLISGVVNFFNIIPKLIDGTVVLAAWGTYTGNPVQERQSTPKIMINNTNYLRITEASSSTGSAGYFGIQIK